MTVPSVSMKSALGMAHPAPVNGGDLALGPDHVALRHLAILLIVLAAASRTLQRERARHGTRCRTSTRSGIPRGPLSRTQRYMPHVSASRPNSFSRCAEPPPRPLKPQQAYRQL